MPLIKLDFRSFCFTYPASYFAFLPSLLLIPFVLMGFASSLFAKDFYLHDLLFINLKQIKFILNNR